jgi:pilus assembly protein Flp/PilA
VRRRDNSNPIQLKSFHFRIHGAITGTLWLQRFLRDESGQDLVEYALVAVLIALGATAGMATLATAFGTAFSKAGSHLTTYTT